MKNLSRSVRSAARSLPEIEAIHEAAEGLRLRHG